MSNKLYSVVHLYLYSVKELKSHKTLEKEKCFVFSYLKLEVIHI